MNREQKAAVVEQIASEIQEAEAVFAVDYRGISVPQAAELRARLRDADASFRIVKNSLTERAADKAGADFLRGLLDGPTALTFVRGDAATAAKALADFSRAADLLEFKGGVLGEEELSVDQIKSIARLPARDVLYAQVVGTVSSPLTGLVRGLSGLISGLGVQLQQIVTEGLLPDGGAPAPEEAEAEAAPEPQPEDQEDSAPAPEEPTPEPDEDSPAPEEPAPEETPGEGPEEAAAVDDEAAAEQTETEADASPAAEDAEEAKEES